ncbi:MAG: NUDIX domain-containing protein [Ardenticatenaceae bacterium]|nr:NUDIX domain-containing protein [Anaerolineales bacterium]MCB8921126.1 NUDIX domain-containing protein [Ardenticatenaceae bacterium]MCB8990831.1 NUDIX domain-containing protein [Ardenticatenaceae bacterium]MCB9004475.1 NUDIX domain-containing protein [Ardenticatenaceae bacterium]
MMTEHLSQLPLAQRWQQQKYPAPIVVALIRRTGNGDTPRYLLIRRNGRPYAGQWALVGGKWDFGETLAAAIIREVQEETGLMADFVALRGIVSERVTEGEKGAHFLLLVCDLAAPNGEAQEQQEGAVAWFSRAEIDALHAQQAIIPSDYAMIAQFAGSETAVPLVEAEMVGGLGGETAVSPELASFMLYGRSSS